ncbi:hypothetical protein [Buttiauxella izardii]|uniref:Lipoprotein n=1 Tax=Buttiauxella izardii TaxID=82991 RepID=A0A3A5JW19_9ENTR|nr:hypothetical protein [Buttiauxella izardii]RJT26047.1 hypothetical protein D6029_06650 [Buttiauxella izardii]
MNKLIVLLPFLLVACTTTTEINRGNGKKQFLIACGASTPWSICYDKANEVCPSGYNDVSKSGGFNRKELTVECIK